MKVEAARYLRKQRGSDANELTITEPSIA